MIKALIHFGFIYFLCGTACAAFFLVPGDAAGAGKELDVDAHGLSVQPDLTATRERSPAKLPLAFPGVESIVFDNDFGANVDYTAFENSYYEALSLENSGGYNDSPTLKITIPEPGPGNPGWAGGSFWTRIARDLSNFNSLTFYARANQPLNLSECGIGIPIEVPNLYQTSVSGLALDTSWKQVILPIPDPGKLTAEQGLFWFAHGTSNVEIWVDEVIFGRVTGITNPRPSMWSESMEVLLNEEVSIYDTKTVFSVNGGDVEVEHSPAYFNYSSSDTAVVASRDGVLTAVGAGTATITAMLIDTEVQGEVIVTVIGPPTEPAPTPTLDQANVLSIFSDAYSNNIDVTTWRTAWSSAITAVFDQQIQGDNVKAYTGLINNAYVGIDFSDDQIDATGGGMTHFTMDVFAPTGSVFTVKLVDFGPDGGYGGGDDTEKSLIFHGGSVPPFSAGAWVTLDVSLTDFEGMNFGNVAQMVLQSINIDNVWVDNIYFHSGQTSDIGDIRRGAVTRPILGANVPNPFNAATEISFRLPAGGSYQIMIFDVSGREVRTFEGISSAGPNSVHWNGQDGAGRQVASGAYFYRLVAGEYSETKKMALIK